MRDATFWPIPKSSTRPKLQLPISNNHDRKFEVFQVHSSTILTSIIFIKLEMCLSNFHNPAIKKPLFLKTNQFIFPKHFSLCIQSFRQLPTFWAPFILKFSTCQVATHESVTTACRPHGLTLWASLTTPSWCPIGLSATTKSLKSWLNKLLTVGPGLLRPASHWSGQKISIFQTR